MSDRDSNDVTWPKAQAPQPKKSKGHHVWKWAPLVAALAALANSTAGYIDTARKQAEQTATNEVNAGKSYDTTRAAVAALQSSSEEHADDIKALREAVAELRGALLVLGKQKPNVTGPADRVTAALDTVQAAPPPTLDDLLPARPPTASKAEVAEQLKAAK